MVKERPPYMRDWWWLNTNIQTDSGWTEKSCSAWKLTPTPSSGAHLPDAEARHPHCRHLPLLGKSKAWGRQVDFSGAPESQPKAFQKGRRRSESKNTTVLTSRSIAPAPSDCVGGLSVPCANIMWPVCCLTGTYVAPLSPLMCVNLSTLLNPPNSHLPHLWRWIATLLWELNMLIHSKCPGINWALN